MTGPRSALVAAWVSVALVFVAIPMGSEAATALMAARGYGVAETEPPGAGLWGFSLFALIVLPPVIAATWFGHRASRAGRASGAAAAILALVLGGGLVLVDLAAELSRLLGWPGVLGCGAVLGASVLLVIAHRRSRIRARRGPPVQPGSDVLPASRSVGSAGAGSGAARRSRSTTSESRTGRKPA